MNLSEPFPLSTIIIISMLHTDRKCVHDWISSWVMLSKQGRRWGWVNGDILVEFLVYHTIERRENLFGIRCRCEWMIRSSINESRKDTYFRVLLFLRLNYFQVSSRKCLFNWSSLIGDNHNSWWVQSRIDLMTALEDVIDHETHSGNYTEKERKWGKSVQSFHVHFVCMALLSLEIIIV